MTTSLLAGVHKLASSEPETSEARRQPNAHRWAEKEEKKDAGRNTRWERQAMLHVCRNIENDLGEVGLESGEAEFY